jgi:small multidrug resistance pump
VSWLLLALGIVLEVVGTLCMKASNGFGDWRAAAMMYVFYAGSLTALTFAFAELDVSVGYAMWSGLGLVLMVIAGILWFKEPASLIRLFFMALILCGLVGLHLVGSSSGRSV